MILMNQDYEIFKINSQSNKTNINVIYKKIKKRNNEEFSDQLFRASDN